jgi:hypothetical protein
LYEGDYQKEAIESRVEHKLNINGKLVIVTNGMN